MIGWWFACTALMESLSIAVCPTFTLNEEHGTMPQSAQDTTFHDGEPVTADVAALREILAAASAECERGNAQRWAHFLDGAAGLQLRKLLHRLERDIAR